MEAGCQLSAVGGQKNPRNTKVKSGGQECPPYTSKVNIPTLRLRSGQAFSQRTREMGHPIHGCRRLDQNEKARVHEGTRALELLPRFGPGFISLTAES
jgi:hypothetical protein